MVGSKENFPDLPTLPMTLSADQLARVSRFLEKRDGRRGLRGSTVQFEEPDVPSPFVRSFEMGAAQPEQEKIPLLETTRIVVKSAELLTLSGHRFYCLLILDAQDDFQLWNTEFLLPHPAGSPPNTPLLLSQDDEVVEETCQQLRATPGFQDLTLIPFAYRYFDVPEWPRDPHVDDNTGWSHTGSQIMNEIVQRAIKEGVKGS